MSEVTNRYHEERVRLYHLVGDGRSELHIPQSIGQMHGYGQIIGSVTRISLKSMFDLHVWNYLTTGRTNNRN